MKIPIFSPQDSYPIPKIKVTPPTPTSFPTPEANTSRAASLKGRKIHQIPSVVQKYYEKWTAWWNADKKRGIQKGKELLSFIENKKHFEEFKELAKKNRANPPTPFGTWKEYYDTAVSYLGNWIKEGGDPNKKAPVSEFLNDLYLWIS